MNNDIYAHRIRVYTQLLREDSDPLWTRLRELLAERGVDSTTAFIADFHEDDTDYYEGFIVTADRKIHRFTFNHRNISPINGFIGRWNEISSPAEAGRYQQSVSTALGFIGS
jgi:hypothetical protein